MTDTVRWQAVMTRDSAMDGVFVFAVQSTKVYCRPSCPSRRAKRENVSFFAAPVEAEAAGFRACKRCRPHEIGPSEEKSELMERVCREIESRSPEVPSLSELASLVGMSSGHLQRTFKRIVGVSPRDYAHAGRARRLRTTLRKSRTVTEAQYEAGLGSSSRLYEGSNASLGMTPSTYRKGGQGMTIGFGLTSCSLGEVLVAATERGVCAVRLGEAGGVLVDELREEFPNAIIRRDREGLDEALRAVTELAEGRAAVRDLPLDVQGTSFQWRVWRVLQQVPAGETVSYGELAQRVGVGGGARAVGAACAANPVAMLIPCHRVVRGDGALGGFRWGVDRKKTLLAKEQATAAVTG